MGSRVASVSPFGRWICFSCRKHLQWPSAAPRRLLQALHTDASAPPSTPIRKQLKDEAKRKRLAGEDRLKPNTREEDERTARWELTVGIEIHAQLNTERKLFSRALASTNDTPNSQVAPFDVSIPGSQPRFQTATLPPALRAALALNCNIQQRSTFDRKHYFYADQPAGYQITQYYAPLARDGYIRLDRHDGIAADEGEEVMVGIKQIQMEQDTAKTIQQPPDTSLLDYNRVGHPLIEIITLPQIHHPQTAAACVRKIQQVLQAVSSVTNGMELGGLRADVNVSVRLRGGNAGASSYYGIHGLGTRTEIKNLSSFKAIEEAIVAERNRQIAILESGGIIEGETRGWSLGSTETRKLRGKEGEVDYRYMPDPDLPPVLIGQSLVNYLKLSLPLLPDDQTSILTARYGLSLKDAKTLVSLDGGERLDYYQEALRALEELSGSSAAMHERGKLVGNW
jgi:aspartyl-tRNA(Asn)/glutamyl-tRNA(Gln) amidotransferase subunit B